jgi:hypothetical protein
VSAFHLLATKSRTSRHFGFGPTSDINHAAAMARSDSDPVGCRGRFKLPI